MARGILRALRIRGTDSSRARTLPVCVAVLFLATALAGAQAANATDLSGPLSGYLSAGVYRIVDDIHVPAGETLILAPGVTFQFEDSFWEEYEFDIYGTLLAEATPADPIRFQAAPGAAEYNYIRITTSSSRLQHCIVEDAGKVSMLDEGGLWIDGCSPRIENCIVRDGHWHGIYVTGGGARPQIDATTVSGNDGDGIDGDSGAGLYLVNCVVSGNSGDGVCVANGANTIVGCLIVRNGEDGIDSHGLTDYDATVINCTIAANASENLSDASGFDLYNTIVVGSATIPELVAHSYLVSDPAFFRFADYAGGNYRLADDSPCLNRGTRFGPPASWLPESDLDGNPRLVAIIDMGAYESPELPDPATAEPQFSRFLLRPRMTQPVIRDGGEEFSALIGLLGEYGSGEAWATLTDPLGVAFPLTVTSVSAQELSPGSDLSVQLFAPGLEVIQEVVLAIPPETPADFYDIRIGLGPHEFFSIHAVRIVGSYPDTWRFLHITDTHIGYDEEEYTSAERYRFFIREANFLNPDFVVVTGDICENQTLWNTAFIDSMLAVTTELRVPIFAQPGNHDYYNIDGETFHPGYPLHYFQRISRFRNAHFRFGEAHFLAFDVRDNLGLLEFYRCLGPTTSALDWGQAILSGLDPATSFPRFFMMHGPNYDYFSWNAENVGRVRELMNGHEVSLCLCGHTHRFETFLNEGDNYLGRNDFTHEDDWERDVPFPGFPLHAQCSSLGKEEHLPIPAETSPDAPGTALADDPAAGGSAHALAALPGQPPPGERRGLFGDDIGWRYVQVVGNEVAFFTADTDGDGFRNTEDPWMLGDLLFSVDHLPDGVIVSTVQNDHYEDWADVRHFIPAVPGASYQATGGTIVRCHPDGVVEVAVAMAAARSPSVVVLTPADSGLPPPTPLAANWSITPNSNPFADRLHLRARWVGAAGSPQLAIFDGQGRCLRDLSHLTRDTGREGEVSVDWDGQDGSGRPVPPGVYFIRLTDGCRQAILREVRIR